LSIQGAGSADTEADVSCATPHPGYEERMSFVWNLLKLFLLGALLLLVAVFAVRAFQAMRGPPLSPWHQYVPAEPTPGQMDQMGWEQWMAAEAKLFAAVEAEMAAKMPAEGQVPQNRYWAQAPMHPANLPQDWNRSYRLQPESAPAGVAVMLHGLTDSPYSLRHVARAYAARGWLVIGLRLPGHGTVPAGLTKARVADWEAATRMAVRAAVRAAPGQPLHVVGYSNGAALAVVHALAATADPSLGTPQRLVLISPMVGLTPFARFTGLAGLPAVFPAFVQAAWLDVLPEYNPFKYNSFPVRAGQQAHALTVVLAERMEEAQAEGRVAKLPPILTFQSVVDSTVSAPAVVSGLYDLLPANGSELVLFDVNRAAYVGPMLRPSALAAADALLPQSPRRYRLSLLTNAAPGNPDMVVRSFEAGTTGSTDVPLGIPFRRDFFSLGHVALPFPLSDGLYGADPDPADNQGVALGALAVRGESGVLGLSAGALARVSSNPFMPWMLGRIDAALAPPPAAATGRG
jgi:alpha-beta hydrolase superfamily lysophospholipase